MTPYQSQGPISVRVLSCRTTLFNPPEFLPAEVMSTELPRRCPACRSCKECQFRMDSLTFKENTEYEVILNKLRLDVERKQWIAGYPFNTMVEKLIDNYNQARGCMSRMETRLVKKGRIAEFNRQFQDNVHRQGCLQAHLVGGGRPVQRRRQLHQHGGGIQNRPVCHHPAPNLHE